MRFSAFRIGLVGTLGVGAGWLILSSIVSLSTIITYIGAALFLALGLDPAVNWLERRGLPRKGAIGVVLGVVLALLAGIIWAVVPIVAEEIAKLTRELPNVLALTSDASWVASVQREIPWLDLQGLINSVSTSITNVISDPGAVSQLASGVLGALVSIGSGLFGGIIVVILTLYFTASLASFKRGAAQLVPASKRERFVELTEQITDSVGRFVVGQITLAAINGAASFVFLSIIRAPFPVLLAVIAFVFSLIPLVGTLSGSILIVLISLIPGLGSPLTGLVAAIYYVVYMQVEAYVLSPHIMNRAVQVPGAVVLIAALAGGSLLGVLGALIAIPAAAAALLIIRQIVIPRQNER
ncbi:MAG TPA: AI-2E family transporter [Microbacteriaceae bacterium]|nr:AI-2E family transporter [Microbacteriaceae bacterium]